jgi:WD40 repeat protein
VFRGHTEKVLSVQFSPDGDRLLTAARDKTVRVWDTASRAEGPALAPRESNGTWGTGKRTAYNRDGTRLLSWGVSAVAVWDTRTGAVVLNQQVLAFGRAGVVFSPDGSRVLVPHAATYALKVWDATTGQEMFTVAENGSNVDAAALSPDGKRLAVLATTGELRLWENGGLSPRTLTITSYSQANLIFTPDGKRVVVYGGAERAVKVWDPATGAVETILDRRPADARQSLFQSEHTVTRIEFSPDGSRALTVWQDGAARVHDAATWRELATLEAKDATPMSAFSRDGGLVAVVAAGGPHVFDVTTGREVSALTGHSGEIRSLAFSPDGARVVTTTPPGAQVWDVRTGDAVLSLPGNESAVFSPDGDRLVTADNSGVWVWDAAPLNRAFRPGGR